MPSADFSATQSTPPTNSSFIVSFQLSGFSAAYAGGAAGATLYLDAGSNSGQVLVARLTSVCFSEVVMWKVFPGNTRPYPEKSPSEVVKYVTERGVLQRPINAATSDEVWALMLSCWSWQPTERLGFTAVSQRLRAILKENSSRDARQPSASRRNMHMCREERF